MAQQIIFRGTVADDGTGDDLRTAFGKVNDNFTELYSAHGSGPVSGVGSLTFATINDMQSGIISSSINNVQVLGYSSPGDNGGGVYQRQESPTAIYADSGPATIIPPNAVSGAPSTIYITTVADNNSPLHGFGETYAPIYAGSMVVALVYNYNRNSFTPITPPSSFLDSAGNTYDLAANIFGSIESSIAVYFSNPINYAPPGTNFSDMYNQNPSQLSLSQLNVFQVPGFAGASVDQTASVHVANVATGGPGGTASVTTGSLSGTPEFVIGFTHVGQGRIESSSVYSAYAMPSGWLDLSPAIIGRNILGCTIVNSTAPVVFDPTFTDPNGGFGVSTLVVTFKASSYNRTVLDPSYWQLVPTWPVHTAQYGITPSSPDNRVPFINFSRWLASIAPPSSTSDGAGIIDSGSATFSIANPAVVTLNLTAGQVGNGMQHTLRNGQSISFSTTGELPHDGGTQIIVPGQRYFVQYGTVLPASVQISDTSIFVSDSPSHTSAKGTPISTAGATQSGVHSYTTYGENWTDFIVDPGIYNSSQNVAPGRGVGLKRWRMRGPGARFQSGAFVDGFVWGDVNAATDSTQVVYSAKFKTTKADSSMRNSNSITLFTPGQASNFYVNSWVLLMALELQGSTSVNWNQYYFEYAKIKSVDAGTGVITFYDTLQHNYRSTYPLFAPRFGTWSGTGIGPATIVQMVDTFDQEIEIHGVTFTGPNEMNFAGVRSLKLIDCYIYGWGFKTGPFPSTMEHFEMRGCVVENFQSEIDKMVGTMHFIDCTFDKNSFLIMQSSSTNKMIIERCKMYGGMPGTPKDLTIRDSYIAGAFVFGTVFGGTERVLLDNTHIQRTDSANAGSAVTLLSDVVFVDGTVKVLVGVTVPFLGTTWNGPFVIPSGCPITWSAPNTKVMICSAAANPGQAGIGGPITSQTNGMIRAFTVLDTYTDALGNFCVDTDMPALPATAITLTGSLSAGSTTLVVTAISPADALPLQGMTITGGDLPAGTTISAAVGAPNQASPLNTGNYTLSNASPGGSGTSFTVSDNFRFLQHPCPRLTVRSCTEGQFATDWAGAPPDIPMYSYFRRAVAGFPFATFALPWLNVPLAGNLMSWTIDVKKAYTGSSGTGYICTIVMFGWKNVSGNYYPTWVQQKIDLTKVGLRTITQTAATSPGGTADSLVAVPFWLTGSHWFATGVPAGSGIAGGTVAGGDTLAHMPAFVMTAQTDQGIDFGSEMVNSLTSGNDLLSDSMTHSGNDSAPATFATTKYYVAEGDSITAGPGIAGYPSVYGNATSHLIGNLATGGAFLSTLQQRQSELDYIIGFKRGGGDHYVLSVMIGTNDACFGYTGGTRTAFLTQLAAYCDHNRSAGWHVVLCTQISRGAPATVSGPGTSGGTPDSELIPINTELRLWTTGGSIVPGIHADDICDFAGNAAFLPGGTVYNNTTNYLTDKTHPNVTGEALLESIIAPILTAAL